MKRIQILFYLQLLDLIPNLNVQMEFIHVTLTILIRKHRNKHFRLPLFRISDTI